MDPSSEYFIIKYKNELVTVYVIAVDKQTLYRVKFRNANFLLTRAKDINGSYFWTSIPEGNQRFAEEIGPLIEEHIKSL